VGFLTVDSAFAAKKPSNAPLLKLFETSWQEDLADDPNAASALGDHRYDDKLTDMSPEAIARRSQRAFTRLAALRKINREKLEKADQLNYDLFERETRVRIDEANFKPYLYATRTFDGPQLLPELAEVLPFQTCQGLRQLDRAHQCERRVHRPVDRAVRPGRHRATHAAARHHPESACSDPAATGYRPGGQPVLRTLQEDSGRN
jgi:uncharacterized protein (DUF885 family)